MAKKRKFEVGDRVRTRHGERAVVEAILADGRYRVRIWSSHWRFAYRATEMTWWDDAETS